MILWRNRKKISSEELKHIKFPAFKIISRSFWPDIALLIVLALIVFTRFWVIRSLDLPMGWDSYQHTMIAQLLVDHGGLFSSWQPYTDLTTFTYHFGFHIAVAVFDWITHMAMSKAVLWVGQLLNVLAVMALIPTGDKSGAQQVGRGDSRVCGWITLTHAHVLCELGDGIPNWQDR